MTELSKIASISGQGGLFLVHTALKNGVVMESLDEKRTKLVSGPTSKVSILSEISIYTTSAEGSVPLEDVLKKLYEKYKTALPANPKSDGADLKKLLVSVLPDADLERVYVSDIKKLVNWYQILVVNAPELFESKKEEEVAGVEPTEDPKASKPKKAAKKKKGPEK